MSVVAVAAGILPGRTFGAKYDGSRKRTAAWQEYIQRIGNNDEFALAAFMDETGPLVFATVGRILHCRQDAEDVVAEVYSQVWRTAATYATGRGSVGAWLTTIARTRAIDRLRASSTITLKIETVQDIAKGIADAESTAGAFETKNRLNGALRTLPFEHRRAIELAYFFGFTMSEIAECLGQPVGTVKSRIRSGLMRLRLVLPKP